MTDMEMSRINGNLYNFLDVIQPVLDDSEIATAYVGGLPTDILLDHRTIIDVDTKTILAPPDCHVPAYRENGTLRDIDIFCFTNNSEAIEGLSQKVSYAIDELGLNKTPELALSGYEKVPTHERWLQLVSHVTPISDAHLAVGFGNIQELVPRHIFEDTWKLVGENTEIDIMHPVLHAYNYRIRSIAGLRPKDEAKVRRLEARLEHEFDEEEWSTFSALKTLGQRVASELTLREVLGRYSAQKLCMTLGRMTMKQIEKNSTLTRYAQSLDDNPIGLLARYLVKSSRSSFVTARSKND